MSYEKKIEKEIIKYSLYKGKWNAFKQIELKMRKCGNWVMIIIGKQGKFVR